MLFVQHAYTWANRQERKRCLFVLLGAPDAGKTTSMTSLALFMGPYGMIEYTTTGKANNFLLEQLPNNKSVIIDEARVDDEFVNRLKLLSSGTGTFVNVKGVKGEYVSRTTICLMSNNLKLFGDDPMSMPMWRSRMFYHVIGATPDHIWIPETRTMSLNPQGWYGLFKKYGLMVADIQSMVGHDENAEEDDREDEARRMFPV